jgi:hypothetical protein
MEDCIRQRREFYTSESVDNFLKKHGVPKSRHAVRSLVALANGKSEDQVDAGDIDLLGHVYFQVHAQQINIRDKANGKLIVSIRR